MSEAYKEKKVKFPIGVKLSVIIGSVVLVALLAVTFLNSYFVGQDVKNTAEENNLSVNVRAASTLEDKLSTIRSNVYQILDLINVVSGGRSAAIAKQAEAFFFERNPDIAAIYVLSEESLNRRLGSDIRIINTQYFTSSEIDPAVVNTFISQNGSCISRSCIGETIAVNASPFFDQPVMALLFPWKENGLNQTCVIIFSIESLSEILGTDSTNTTYLINDTDDLLCHPDTDRGLIGESMRNDPLVVKMRENNQNNDDSRQIPYKAKDENGKMRNYYGAYRKLSFGDIVVITTVPLDYVLEGVRVTRRNNIYLTLVVLFVSIAIILSYSRYGISRHLRKLSAAANEIQKGNFKTEIIDSLNLKRQDEIGILNESFVDERESLLMMAKFTNMNVAKAIATKTLDFEPHLKDITIFFSDIRGFTAISDGFNKRFGPDSGAEIIGFLNDYMSRMVECVELSHGNIDKFEGDAVMAVWGILRNDSLAFEELPDGDPEKIRLEAEHRAHVLEDTTNAITGTIAMRYALMKYNKDAEAFTKEHADEPKAKYKPHVRIGCGLNVGRASVGLMGSKDKMEYTSIGDPVNFASRTEASNKPCGTDILITEDTYSLLKKDYIRCEENNFQISPENLSKEIVVEMIPVEFEVKGKGTQHFYGVVNMPGFDIEEFFKRGNPDFTADPDCIKAVGPTGPKTLNEVRTMLGIEIPDFAKVNLNAEENKIQQVQK